MITQTSTPQLFKHKEQGFLVIVTSMCQVHRVNGFGCGGGVIYEMARMGDDRDEEPYVHLIEDFEEQFEEVNFQCGVDLYALLHDVLTKTVAVEVCHKIEAALAALETKKYGDESDAFTSGGCASGPTKGKS